MPAMKITIASPTPFQTSTRATDSRAICGSVSHFGPVKPMTSIVRLIRPLVGCIITLNVMPTATKLTSTGKNTIERIVPLSLIRDVTSIAERHPEDDLQPAGDDGVDERVAQTVGQRRFTEELAEVVESDELPVEQRPAGERVEERHPRRHDEDGEEDDPDRQVEPVRVRRSVDGSSRRRDRAASGRVGPGPSAGPGPTRVAGRVGVEGHAVTSPGGRVAGPASRRPRRRARRRPRRCAGRSRPRR